MLVSTGGGKVRLSELARAASQVDLVSEAAEGKSPTKLQLAIFEELRLREAPRQERARQQRARERMLEEVAAAETLKGVVKGMLEFQLESLGQGSEFAEEWRELERRINLDLGMSPAVVRVLSASVRRPEKKLPGPKARGSGAPCAQAVGPRMFAGPPGGRR